MDVKENEKMSIHRRKSSRDENENVLTVPSPESETEHINGTRELSAPPPPRPRTTSTPVSSPGISHSQSYPGLSQTSPAAYRGPPRPPNDNMGPPSSTFRSSFAPSHSHSHSRTRSVSSPFSPSLPSPLSSSFASQTSSLPSATSPSYDAFPASPTAPQITTNGASPPVNHARRHSRLHSRNLSVFFPRPGSLPQTTISEDGAQEVEFSDPNKYEAAAVVMPSAGSSVSVRGDSSQLNGGFSFGGRPPNSAQSASFPGSPPASGASRRGHHHKHSMSHNFFSFLEPGATPSSPAELHTSPTPIPISPWTPMSAFPQSAAPTKTSFGMSEHQHDHDHNHSHTHSHSPTSPVIHFDEVTAIPPGPVGVAIAQFTLGAWLWVTGQQVGSLSCTGLGYWVVFDAFGVAMSRIIPIYLSQPQMQSKTRRPYGNARIETVITFAQSVYLMFASVYICKETVEHFLLSAGEGHHHHYGDEETDVLGINFPIFMTLITVFSLLGTAFSYNNHSKLINITGNRLPTLLTLIRSSFDRHSSSLTHAKPNTTLGILLSNPYVASPIFFSGSILLIALLVPNSLHRLFDLVLASIETFVTFKLAYRACVVLGAVLLQTSPRRGLPGGRMEAFLRVMREIERHPQVIHLPAPHIWQLTPSHAHSSPQFSPSSSSDFHSHSPKKSLVVTLELHVRDTLADDDVLQLTRWAWERVMAALNAGRGQGLENAEAEAEVTIGFVRG